LSLLEGPGSEAAVVSSFSTGGFSAEMVAELAAAAAAAAACCSSMIAA